MNVLFLLLDEHISPKVEEELLRRRPEIRVTSVHSGKEGLFLGATDEVLLHAASAERMTLVTYDQKTIPLLLQGWGAKEIPHGGIIFVDNRTIAPNDFGALLRALTWLWDAQSDADWTNAIVYLQRARD